MAHVAGLVTQASGEVGLLTVLVLHTALIQILPRERVFISNYGVVRIYVMHLSLVEIHARKVGTGVNIAHFTVQLVEIEHFVRVVLLLVLQILQIIVVKVLLLLLLALEH